MTLDSTRNKLNAVSTITVERGAGEKMQALLGCEVFGSLSQADLKRLADQLVEKRLRKGESLFQEDDPWMGPYLVRSGEIKAFRMATNGRRQVVTLVGEGELIAVTSDFDGGLADIRGGLHLSIARANNDCVVYLIPKEAFTDLIKAHPEVALHIIRLLGQRLQLAFDLVAELSFYRAPQRVAALLLRLAREHGIPGDLGISLDVVLSRLDLAEAVGTSQETVIRVLSNFNRAGLIDLRKRRIFILDVEGLANWAEQDSP